MKLTTRFLPLLLAVILPHFTSAQSAAPSPQQSNARLDWWRDARFGMFIHWGVYSGLGNEYHGQKGQTYAEHIQRVLKIPIADYRKEVAGNFDPTKFDADAWVKLAKDAGMKYIVITAKHHDGFAMWPTKVNDYNVMDATPWHHDPMKDLKAACDKYGIKFGFYYSHAFDWGSANGPGNDWDYNNPGGDKKIGGDEWWKTMPEFQESARQYVDGKVLPQLKELVEMYHPDILWFDTPHKLPPSENLRIMNAVRAMDPSVVINGRIVWGKGDYENTCDTPVEFPPHTGDWEAIPTTNDSYGWNPLNNTHKPASHFIGLLAKASARGGNILMNVGPMGNGEIDPKDVKILDGIADWWKVNGGSIRGTTRTPLPVQTWGQSTRKGDKLYLHVFQWPGDGKLVVGGLKSDAKAAYLLSGSSNTRPKLTITRDNPLDISIQGLPPQQPGLTDSVVVLECAGDVVADSRRLLQPEYPMETLHVFDAILHDDDGSKGDTKVVSIDDKGRPIQQSHGRLHFGEGSKLDDFVKGWENTNQSVSWQVRLDHKATYEVSLDYVAEKDSAGGAYIVRVGSMELKGTVTPTLGSIWTARSRVDSLGQVTLGPGDFEIKIEAEKINGKELFNPRKIVLKPVNN